MLLLHELAQKNSRIMVLSNGRIINQNQEELRRSSEIGLFNGKCGTEMIKCVFCYTHYVIVYIC